MGGSQPVAIAENQGLVDVLNAGGAGSLVGFRSDFNGELKQIKNSTTFLSAAASGGSSLTLSPDGQFLVVTEKVANNIDVFHVNPDGTLGPIVTNPSQVPGTRYKEQAFGWMERAYQEQSMILQYLKMHPFFDPVRDDPRFADLLGRVGPS